MTGLDTNVLVRFLVQDEPRQGRQASALFKSFTGHAPGFISLVSLAEMVWVLRSRYHVTRGELLRFVDQLLETAELVLESAEAVSKACERFAQSRADFADCLIELSGNLAGCNKTVTFDAKAAKSAGMKLLS